MVDLKESIKVWAHGPLLSLTPTTNAKEAIMIVLDPNIPNQEELVLRLLSKVLLNPIKYGEEVCTLVVKRRRELAQVQTIDDIYEISPTVCEWLMSRVEEKHLLKVSDKKAKYINKGLNRTEYQLTGLLEHVQTVDKQGDLLRRWKGTIGVKCAGLLERMVVNLYGDQAEPCVLSVLNSLPPDQENGLPHLPVEPFHWDNMLSQSLVVSGERMAVQMNSPAWSMVLLAFPKAIDARSYIHGIGAPLIQGGYLPHVKSVLRNLHVCKPVGWRLRNLKEMKAVSFEEFMAEAVKGMPRQRIKECEGDMKESWEGIQEATCMEDVLTILTFWSCEELVRAEPTYELIPAKDDGSGRYHPDADSMKELVAKFGPVVFQVRAMDPKTGVFTKGILAPDSTSIDAEGNPCITFSWAQVKGRHKDGAKKKSDAGEVLERNLHVGILRAWDRKRTMVGCFEMLENIAAVQRTEETDTEFKDRQAQILADTHSLVEDAMKELGKDGIEGLLASIGKDDKMLSLVIKLLAKAQLKGINIDPTSIDRVKKALSTKLRNRLWSIAQGAGIEGRQLVIVNDASLERGECVEAHHKVGTKLAAWRFPIVLSQSLLTLKTVSPRPHQMINGKVVEQCIYMNPEDVLDMQGDDDGDIVAVSTDPRVIRLFSNKLDDRRFAIEPKGEKLDFKTNSAPGMDYLRSSPMGQVGLMTICRAKLLAVGDIMGALAMSVLIQECIDKAKRHVRWTDWEKAAVLTNWTFKDGVYHIHAKDTDHNFLDQRPQGNKKFDAKEIPVPMVLKWVSERMRLFGCDTRLDQYPLGWRKNKGTKEEWTGEESVVDLEKQIDPAHWNLSRDNQGGYTGGNLVHEAFDHAKHEWQKIADNFAGQGEDGDIGTLLLRLLKEEGHKTTFPDMDWKQYMEVKSMAGLSEFAENMKLAMRHDSTTEDGSDNKDRYTQIQEAYVLLHQQLKEYVKGNTELGLEGKGIQGLVDIWCMETTTWYRVDGGEGPRSAWYTTNREEIPAGAKFSRVNNTNHAINAVCWPGSPIMDSLGIKGEDTCGFLTPSRLKKYMDHVMASESGAFAALSELIWKQKSKDDKPGIHEMITGIPVHACECCREILQTTLVRKFRSAKKQKEKSFLGRLCSELNMKSKGTYEKTNYSRLGVYVANLLTMSDNELQEYKEELQEDTSTVSKYTVRAITQILNGEGVQ
jgi:hypothetical protein